MLKLKVRMDEESGEFQDLDRCPGYHADRGKGCSPTSVACHLGGIDDMADQSRGTNGILAYFSLLSGTRYLRGLSESKYLPHQNASSVRLYVNNTLFTDSAGDSRPVWAVILKDRWQEHLEVTVYTDLGDAEEAYRREVADYDSWGGCLTGLAEHGLAEPCSCRDPGVTEEQLELRDDLARTVHCLAETFPLARCMCGSLVQMPGLPDSSLPTLSRHLDEVIDEALPLFHGSFDEVLD
jgi:hypothetical protein